MKRLILIACLFFSVIAVSQTSPPGTTKIASDNFTRANAGTWGANWQSSGTDVFSISSNTGICSTGTASQYPNERYTASALSNDQYSSIKVAAWSGSLRQGAGVRMTTGVSGYAVYCSANTSNNCTTLILVKDSNFTSTSATTLKTFSSLNISPTSTVSLLAVGTTLSVYIDGVQTGTNTTDSTYTSGNGGIIVFNQFTSTNGFTYFEAGNNGSSARHKVVVSGN